MDLKEISALVDLINDSSVAEIEIKDGEKSVRITRQGTMTPMSITTHPNTTPAHMVPMSHTPHQPQPSANESSAPAQPETPVIEGHIVRSPMVGTVYLAPSPGAKSFVEIGQAIKSGAVLCIVEAMKMMNQIEADKTGVIKACLVENGLPVEFDQPLFVIE